MIIPINSHQIRCRTLPQFYSRIFCGDTKISGRAKPQTDAAETSIKRVLKTQSPFNISQNGKVMHISFCGKFNNPVQPVIQFKVRGVSYHQKNDTNYYVDRNVEKLADSKWRDGQLLDFVAADKKISLFDKKFGEIGRVPEEISFPLLKLIEGNENDFKFRLSNVLAGTSKGASTIGLRVNLSYEGKDNKLRNETRELFDSFLNSDDKAVKEVVMKYQPITSPKEVLNRIFDVTELKHGREAVRDLRNVINNICNEINNPANNNILLLGHCMPDGDTIGCLLGMHSAIKAVHPFKHVACSIDDDLPGLYRDHLPGIENIKKPYSTKRISEIKKHINELKLQPETEENNSQIKIYEQVLENLKNKKTYFDSGLMYGEALKKYDLVILMDVPSDNRFSEIYKKYIDTAKKVIYIDHHPQRIDAWTNSEEKTGIDMRKIKEENLSLVIPQVPAASELVTIIANEAGLLNKTMSTPQYGKQYTAAIVSGISSDTGTFVRTASISPDDSNINDDKFKNFMPEGIAKWLINKLGSTIDKKWLRENIVYDISDTKTNEIEESAREKMVNCSVKNCITDDKLGLGIISVSYNEMYDVWEKSKEFDNNVTLNDVQNAFKYSEVMGALRDGNKSKNKLMQYNPKYPDNIAVLIIQNKEKGKIDEKGLPAKENSIRFSFRSSEGTIHADLLASLFGGGGHGAAAGAKLDLDDINVNSKIDVCIDGKIEKDTQKIYQTLIQNYKIKHDKKLTDTEKEKLSHKINILKANDGYGIQELISNIVFEIRTSENI